MLRFALPLFPGPAHDLRRWIEAVALVGLLWSSLVAFRQPDSRGVVAYSSIAQMGLIVARHLRHERHRGDRCDVPDGQPRPAPSVLLFLIEG